MERAGEYIIPWGRFEAPKKEIVDAMKRKEEGGTGVAERLWDCVRKRQESMLDRSLSVDAIDMDSLSLSLNWSRYEEGLFLLAFREILSILLVTHDDLIESHRLLSTYC
jgi:hypothetical protein